MEKVSIDRATLDTLLQLAQRAPKHTSIERFAVSDAEELVRRVDEDASQHEASGYYQPSLFDPTPYEV